jgi:hypothetical protein
MNSKTMALGTALMLVLAGPVGANPGFSGTTAANFLSVGTGAGILGMGSATLGLPGDLSSVSWNAASLGWLDESQFALAHAGLPDQTSQEWLAYGGRFGSSATRWSMSGLYQSDGAFEGRDASNNPTGDFSVASMALGLNVARPLGRLVTLGLGGKFVNEKLGPVSGTGFTMDAGLQLRAGMLGFGVAAQNLSGGMSYGGARYPFPANVGVGVALNDAVRGLRVALDANFPKSYFNDVRGGVEWGWRDRFAVRAGYRRELGAPSTESLTGPSFGMGGGAHGVWIDYGYLIPGSGDNQHRVSFTFRPGALNLTGSGFHAPASENLEQTRRAQEREESKAAAAAQRQSAQEAKAAAEVARVRSAEEARKARALEVERAKAARDAEAASAAPDAKLSGKAPAVPAEAKATSAVTAPARSPAAKAEVAPPAKPREDAPGATVEKAKSTEQAKKTVVKPKSKKELEQMKKKALEDAKKAVEAWRKN